MSRTLKELAQEALDVQNACNLSGVVHGFSRAITELREHCSGTNEVNRHAICALWSDKIAHLTGTQSFGHERITEAYSWAHDYIKEMNK